MKTDDLIRAMAADTTRERDPARLLPSSVLPVAALAGALFYASFGIRPDWADAYAQGIVLLKQALPPLLAASAFGAVLRLARPEGRLDGWAAGLMVVPLVAIVAFWAAALRTPVAAWPATIRGENMWYCITFVPLIGLPVLGTALWALRRGATTRPGLSGALAGALSGGVSASIYAVHCADDSPMFWGVWYVFGIVLLTLAGTLAGRWILRW